MGEQGLSNEVWHGSVGRRLPALDPENWIAPRDWPALSGAFAHLADVTGDLREHDGTHFEALFEPVPMAPAAAPSGQVEGRGAAFKVGRGSRAPVANIGLTGAQRYSF